MMDNKTSALDLGSINTYDELVYAYLSDQAAIDYSFTMERVGLTNPPSFSIPFVSSKWHYIDPIYPDIREIRVPAFLPYYLISYVTDIEIASGVSAVFSLLVTAPYYDGVDKVLSGNDYHKLLLSHYVISVSDRVDVNVIKHANCVAVVFYRYNGKLRINVSFNWGTYFHYLFFNSTHYYFAQSGTAILRNELNLVGESIIDPVIAPRLHVIVHYTNEGIWAPYRTAFLNQEAHPQLFSLSNTSDSNFYVSGTKMIKLTTSFIRNNIEYCIPMTYYAFGWRQYEYADRNLGSTVILIPISFWPQSFLFVSNKYYSARGLSTTDLYAAIWNNYYVNIPYTHFYQLSIFHLLNAVYSVLWNPSMDTFVPLSMNDINADDPEVWQYVQSMLASNIPYVESKFEYYDIFYTKTIPGNFSRTLINEFDGFGLVIDGSAYSKVRYEYVDLIKPVVIMSNDERIFLNYKYWILDVNKVNNIKQMLASFSNISAIRVSEFVFNQNVGNILNLRQRTASSVNGKIIAIKFYTAYPFLMFSYFGIGDDNPFVNQETDYNILPKHNLNVQYPVYIPNLASRIII